MKVLSLFVVCMALLWSGVAAAQLCRRIEYAEVQDMSDEDLATTYCESAGYVPGFQALYRSALKLKNLGDRDMEQKAAEHRRDLEACTDTLAKIRTTLKKRGLPSPQCEGLKPKPTQ